MTKKRKRRGGPRDDTEDFQMMDVDVNPSPSVPIAVPIASTSTMFNISQWDIDGDRIHATSGLASIEHPTAPQASATDSTTQATFDYNFDVESTFQDVESTFHNTDEDINPEHHDDPSAKRNFLSVSHFCLTTITAVLNHVLFSFLRIPRYWHGSSTPKTIFLNCLDLMVGVSTKIN